MKSILLKLEDELFLETEEQVKDTHTSRNKYIKQAIAAYNKFIKRKKLEEQLRKEVDIIKQDKEEWKMLREIQESSLEDLNKYLDQLENE